LAGFGHRHALANDDGYLTPRPEGQEAEAAGNYDRHWRRRSCCRNFSRNAVKASRPSQDRSAVWTDTVKRGPMVRQVRGLGTLVPREDAIRQIPAQTEATVVRILTLPGSIVRPDTVLLELADPQATQQALDAELSLKSARADLSTYK